MNNPPTPVLKQSNIQANTIIATNDKNNLRS